MNRLQRCLFYSRDFIARNFLVSPIAILYKNQLINFRGIKCLLLLLGLFPFGLVGVLFGLFDIGIIYKLDSIYNITNNKNNHISPIIMNFSFLKNNNVENYTSKIKYYNTSIPLEFILFNETSLRDYEKIQIKYLKNSKFFEKTIDINDYNKLPIYKLFE